MAHKQPPDDGADDRARRRDERRAADTARKAKKKATNARRADAIAELVAANVKALREEQGLSQADLAYFMGYSASTVYWMERDGRRSSESLEAAAEALGVTSAALLAPQR